MLLLSAVSPCCILPHVMWHATTRTYCCPSAEAHVYEEHYEEAQHTHSTIAAQNSKHTAHDMSVHDSVQQANCGGGYTFNQT
jgi:hypothetical protein